MATSILTHASNSSSSPIKGILHFANDFSEFRDAELSSITQCYNIKMTKVDEYSSDCPFKVFENMSACDIKILATRAVSVRSIFQYWTEGSSLQDILKKIKIIAKENVDRDKSFRVNIEAFNRTYTNRTKTKLERIELIADALDMNGPVNLNNPDVVYSLFEYYGPHGTEPLPEPVKVYFGKLITETNREKDIRKFSIKSRKFIGNTSMDPTLSFLMANMAKSCSNTIVLDPFVGTGSLLLACAHHGSYVVGTDINKVLLHGRGRSSRHKQKWRERDENVRANFLQYGLESKYLDVMVADASKHDMWSPAGVFDAIVTDPPYGIREQTKKLDALPEDVKKPDFMPPTTSYNLSDVFSDLLALACKCLKVGGRLVYWLPIHRPDYIDENVPCHPCFRLISNCEQILSTHISRRLITMEKVCEYHDLQPQDMEYSYKDHYKESFRDRYFHITEQMSGLGIGDKN